MTFDLEKKLNQYFLEYKEKLFNQGIPEKFINYYTDYFFNKIDKLVLVYESAEKKLDSIYFLLNEIFVDDKKIDDILFSCDPFLSEYYFSMDLLMTSLEQITSANEINFKEIKSELRNYYKAVTTFIKCTYYFDKIYYVICDATLFLDNSFQNNEEKMYNYISYNISLLKEQYHSKKFKN
ncbi:MAG: hypothetical protein QXR30_02960 [Candidatus Woesearchaeota archaeon]